MRLVLTDHAKQRIEQRFGSVDIPSKEILRACELLGSRGKFRMSYGKAVFVCCGHGDKCSIVTVLKKTT